MGNMGFIIYVYLLPERPPGSAGSKVQAPHGTVKRQPGAVRSLDGTAIDGDNIARASEPVVQICFLTFQEKCSSPIRDNSELGNNHITSYDRR